VLVIVQYFSLRPEEVVRRLARDAIHSMDGAFPRFANLRPRDGEFLQERSELLLGRIATGAQEGQLLTGDLFVEVYHARRFRPARTTVR
jgi:hypothetical protein